MIVKISNVSKRVTNNTKQIKEIKGSLKPVKEREMLKIKTWPITLYHSTINPKVETKTILTDSTWEFVEIYLKQKSNG